MTTILEIVFWASAALVVYPYAGYPLLMWLVAGRRPLRVQVPLGIDADPPPKVSVLIAAYNAEAHIVARLHNLLACQYPLDCLQIVVACDGSQDATAALARQVGGGRIQVLEFGRRRGKAATLMAAMPELHGEVVIFTDASTHFEPQAVQRLVRPFEDPRIGVVAGDVTMFDPSGADREGLYWRLEAMIRRCESSCNGLVGVSGAIYAMRRRWFVTPSRPVINDDYIFPALCRLRHGCRVVFEPTARAIVVTADSLPSEFRRRMRTGAGAGECLRMLWPLLLPTQGMAAISFWSHKLLRWFCPLALLTCLLSSLRLAGDPLYAGLLAVQVAGYLAAVIGMRVRGRHPLARVLRLAGAFASMNLALLWGMVSQWTRTSSVRWEPTARPALPAAALHPERRGAIAGDVAGPITLGRHGEVPLTDVEERRRVG